MQEPRSYLQQLGLSDSEVTVYLAMLRGVCTARDLVRVTRLKRPTVYYALGCLEKRGLLGKTGLSGDKGFFLESPDRLRVLAHQKALEAEKLEACVQDLVSTLQLASPVLQKPVVAMYEGVDAVKNTIMEMLYSRSSCISSVVPESNFFWQVGRDFVETFVAERVRRSIRTKNLWERPASAALFNKYYAHLSEVRLLPEVMRGNFATTTFLYEDKVLIVSSVERSYCVLITSAEYAATMQAWFDGLWSISVPHKVKD